MHEIKFEVRRANNSRGSGFYVIIKTITSEDENTEYLDVSGQLSDGCQLNRNYYFDTEEEARTAITSYIARNYPNEEQKQKLILDQQLQSYKFSMDLTATDIYGNGVAVSKALTSLLKHYVITAFRIPKNGDIFLSKYTLKPVSCEDSLLKNNIVHYSKFEPRLILKKIIASVPIDKDKNANIFTDGSIDVGGIKISSSTVDDIINKRLDLMSTIEVKK